MKVLLAGAEREIKQPRGFATTHEVLKALLELASSLNPDAELRDLGKLAQPSALGQNIDRLGSLLNVFFKYGLEPPVKDEEITPGDYIAAVEVIGPWIEMLGLDRSFRRADAADEVGSGIRGDSPPERRNDVSAVGSERMAGVSRGKKSLLPGPTA
jgi:outer membrane translocation and assembly module TamA